MLKVQKYNSQTSFYEDVNLSRWMFLQKQKFYSSFVAHSWNQLNKAGTNSSGNVPWRGLSENQRNLFFSLFSSFDQNKQGVDCCPAVLLKSVSISVTASLGVCVFWHSTRFRGSSAYLSIYLSIYGGRVHVCPQTVTMCLFMSLTYGAYWQSSILKRLAHSTVCEMGLCTCISHSRYISIYGVSYLSFSTNPNIP